MSLNRPPPETLKLETLNPPLRVHMTMKPLKSIGVGFIGCALGFLRASEGLRKVLGSLL